jgi:hypothetical protein
VSRIYCYPQDHKPKSLAVCRAFAAGCDGEIVTDGVYRGGAAMFYGIDDHNERVWSEVKENSGAEYFYADNAFFDQTRGVYFRVGRNRLQHPGVGASDGDRFARLRLEIKPWRVDGDHILVCPQSDHFMRVAANYPGNWCEDTVARLRELTDREIRVRPWNRNKTKLAQELPAALAGAWALVTYSSASAISAILSGIPAIATGECIVSPMCGGLETIEDPLMPDNRLEWARVIADQQWTLPELADGVAWRRLNS